MECGEGSLSCFVGLALVLRLIGSDSRWPQGLLDACGLPFGLTISKTGSMHGSLCQYSVLAKGSPQLMPGISPLSILRMFSATLEMETSTSSLRMSSNHLTRLIERTLAVLQAASVFQPAFVRSTLPSSRTCDSASSLPLASEFPGLGTVVFPKDAP